VQPFPGKNESNFCGDVDNVPEELVIGILQGLFAVTDDMAKCPADATVAAQALGVVLEDLKAGDMGSVVADMMQALGTIMPLRTDCQSVGAEVQKLLAALGQLTPAAAIANAQAHQAEIKQAAAQAAQCQAVRDFECVGVQLGTVLREVIGEELDPETTTVVPVPESTTLMPDASTTSMPVVSTTTVATTATSVLV
jgi:hypothetical protein